MSDNPFPRKRNFFLEAMLRSQNQAEAKPEPNWFTILKEQGHVPRPPIRRRPLLPTVPPPPDAYPFSGTFIEAPAVYLILDPTFKVIYVGETNDLCRRMNQHHCDRLHRMHHYSPTWVRIEFGYSNEVLRKARERELILRHDPPANRCL